MNWVNTPFCKTTNTKKKTYDIGGISLSLLGSNFGSGGCLSISLLLILLKLLEGLLGNRLSFITTRTIVEYLFRLANDARFFLYVYILEEKFFNLLGDFLDGILSRCRHYIYLFCFEKKKKGYSTRGIKTVYTEKKNYQLSTKKRSPGLNYHGSLF